MTIVAPATPLTAATARLARLLAALRRRTTRHQTIDQAALHRLDLGPAIPPEADRYAPTWQNDMPFFLQQGFGHHIDR